MPAGVRAIRHPGSTEQQDFKSQPKRAKGARSSPGSADGICHIIIILLDLQEITSTGHLKYSLRDLIPVKVK